MRDSIVIERDIRAPIQRVYDALISPSDLLRWHHAGGGWVTPYADVEPRIGGKIKIGYSDAEGVETFDFTAVISELASPTRLVYYLQVEDLIDNDNRLVTYDLVETEGLTHVRFEVDIEHLHDKKLQLQGWTEHIDNLEALISKKE